MFVPFFHKQRTKSMNALEERVRSLIEQYKNLYIKRDSLDRQFDEIFQERYTYNRLPLDLRNEVEDLRSFGRMRSFDRNGEKIMEAEQQVKQLSDLYRNHKVSQEEFEKRYSAITAKDITGKRAYDRIPKDLKEGFEGLHNDMLRSKTESDIKASIERYVNNVKSYDFKNRLAFDQGYKNMLKTKQGLRERRITASYPRL
jgi:hypothetical protein